MILLMKRTMVGALLLCAGCGAASAPSPAPTVRLVARPGATDASLYSPVAAQLQFAAGGCPVDLGTIAGSLTLDPAPPTATRMLLEPKSCSLALVVPAGLALSTSYRALWAGTVRALDGTAIAVAPPLPFKTSAAPPNGSAPVLLGSWPPEGDARLGGAQPVRLFFDEPLAAQLFLDAPSTGASAEVEPSTLAVVVTPRGQWSPGVVRISLSGVAGRDGAAMPAPATVQLSRPSSPDQTPPVFAGAAAVTPRDSSGAVQLSWLPATDDTSAPSAIRYFVYVAAAGATLDWTVPAVVTAPGATRATLALPAGGLLVGVRAEDEAGNVDGNGKVVVAR